MDESDRLHFIKWATSGQCPLEVFEDPEAALARVDAFFDALQQDEGGFYLSLGWGKVWDRVNQ